MKNPLDSIPLTITLGVVFAIIVMVIVPGTGYSDPSMSRWLHIVSGIFWIGLLYYFNVAQIPAMAAAAADQGGPGAAGITRVASVAPTGTAAGTGIGTVACTDWPASRRLMSSRISPADW